MFRAQDPAALARVQALMAEQTAAALAALGVAIPGLGSAVLGLALADGALNALEAHRLAMLDETFQVEQWGEDPEATSRRAALLADVELAERFLQLSAAA